MSATTRKTQPDDDLQPVQNPEDALVRNNFRKGQPHTDLQTVQNTEDALVRNKQERPVRC